MDSTIGLLDLDKERECNMSYPKCIYREDQNRCGNSICQFFNRFVSDITCRNCEDRSEHKDDCDCVQCRSVKPIQKPSDKGHRKQITGSAIVRAHSEVLSKLEMRLKQKGYGTWLSRHEVLGFLTEEYTEAVEAVHSGTLEELKQELMDVAVGCEFAIACINSGTLDW